jgi:hypothetical protein
MYISTHVKYPILVLNLNQISFLSRDFRKKLISNLMKIGILEAELFHADGQTDRRTDMYDKVLRNFSNAPKN